ncbi:acyl-CoA synthetase (AMP-forming)/AMP-acid ligase II [Kribbella sp. VKM Ac-2527]|uniref:Acyl-CoA synthetase (AMP-forming)/AMP-acid ligase II n=1 Tax=Kribbella caucasensis TaxID=2512215 RepID=A0A4R6KQW8_9ACTN|nr:4-coumarate--CoA ligase family protein [Kribbella sp. VKM Ac-2527]TDO55002.1 acyl-CoA synthetase (AMP-forming)/AMP-acid ligase II [Kribbella sp. VKM Ac-2527]
MVIHSEFPPVEVVDVPIHDAVLGRAAEYGDRPALVDGVSGREISYAQLDGMSRRIAAGFAELGIRPGDVIALYSPNTILYPVVFYGATRAGATVTTVNALYTADELHKQLVDSKTKLLVTISLFLPVATAAIEGTDVQEIFVCDQADGFRSVMELVASTGPEPVVEIDPAEDVAVLPYSSGTTGAAKGVMLTHRNIATNIAQAEVTINVAENEKIIAILPFFHIYGLTVLMNLPLRLGATVVVLPKFDLDQFLGTLEKYAITRAFVAPPIVLALAKHPAVDGVDLSALKYVTCAAAPLDGELAEACAKRLGLHAVLQAYGMTELSPGTHAVPQDDQDPPPGAVGKLFPSTEMRLVGADGNDVGDGETGEVWIRGPQVMKGYLGRQAETDATIDPDGWLHTGDIGRVDARGYLYVVDRLKELIKYHGYQVPPAELEAVLLTDSRIADAAVIGVQSEGNEVPKAFVVPMPGMELTEQDVIDYVAARVAPYKKVRQVEFIEAVPKAASGKILRRELRAKEAARE